MGGAIFCIRGQTCTIFCLLNVIVIFFQDTGYVKKQSTFWDIDRRGIGSVAVF